MKQRIAIVAALACLVGAAVFVLSQSDEDPTGAATGRQDAVADLWNRLAAHQGTHLKAWRDAFDGTTPEPSDVLEAFNELAYAVTGPGGFWRRTVPARWMGCEASPKQPVCQALRDLEPEFAEWDRFQKKAESTSAASARRFLKRHHARMVGYFDSYVPPRPSASGLERTGAYQDHLARHLGGSAAPERADDEL